MRAQRHQSTALRTTISGDSSFFRFASPVTSRSASSQSGHQPTHSVYFSNFVFSTFTQQKWVKPKRRKTRTVSQRTSWPAVSQPPSPRPPSLPSSASSSSCKCRPRPRRSPPTSNTKVRKSFCVFVSKKSNVRTTRVDFCSPRQTYVVFSAPRVPAAAAAVSSAIDSRELG